MDNNRSLAEQLGVTYKPGSDGMLYPDLQTEPEETGMKSLRKYGLMRKAYLQEHRKSYYSELLKDGTLQQHLLDVESQAKERLETLMAKLLKQSPAPQQGTLEWAAHMNNLKHQAEEIILSELIYS